LRIHAPAALVHPCTSRGVKAKRKPAGAQAGCCALDAAHGCAVGEPSEANVERGHRQSRRRVLGQNGFGDFCRSCASCARDTCASLHIGHNKSTRAGGRPTGQGLFPTIPLHSHPPWRSDVGRYDSTDGGGRVAPGAATESNAGSSCRAGAPLVGCQQS
jgi:hypothetical protein